MKNQFFQERRRPQVTIPPGGETVFLVASSLGLRTGFKRYSAGTAPEVYHVYLFRPGASSLRKNLGPLKEVAPLSEDELKARMTALFPKTGGAS